MAAMASSSSRHNPFPALTLAELPEPVTRVLTPAKGRMPANDDCLTALWVAGAEPSDVQLSLLGWLAHNSTAASAVEYEAADKHQVFAYKGQGCFELVAGPCIMPRKPAERGGAYTSLVLGTYKRAGASKEVRVTMDAHRLVCCLTQGPKPAGAVAQHRCHNKRCINSEHLDWGSQSENVVDGRKHTRAAGLRHKGAHSRVGCLPGRANSFLGPAVHLGQCTASEACQGGHTGLGEPRLRVRTSFPGCGGASIQALWQCMALPASRLQRMDTWLTGAFRSRQANGAGRQPTPYRPAGSSSAPERPPRRAQAGPGAGSGQHLPPRQHG